MNKLLFLITGLDHAGAEMQVIELARGLFQKGWSILIISLITPSLDIEELKKEGIDYKTLNMNKGIPDPSAIWKLRRMIKEFNPDIVHSHMVHANLLARITRLFTTVPVLVSTAHNTNEGGKLRMLLYRVTDRLCDLMTNVSQEAVESYIRKKVSPKDKLILVPNGINLKRFSKSTNETEKMQVRLELGLKDEFIWLAVGRLSEAKDYTTLIKSFSQVIQTKSNSILLIAGIGEEREALDQLTKSLGLESKIRFLGVRNDIPRLMNASNAYVMSSLWEGMPMVLLEASACELPMVATDVGGNREVVKEGISGYLSRSADSAHLASRMISIMTLSSEKREEMGRNGRNYVMEHYEMESIIAKWEFLYNQLFKSKFSI